MTLLLAVIGALCLPFASASSLLISIPPSTHLPNPQTLSASTSASLLSGSSLIPTISTPLTTRSTLEFHNLTVSKSDPSPRSYRLLISSLTHVFASYRVDIIPGGTAPAGAISYSSADTLPATVEGVWETYPDAPWDDRGVLLGGKAAQDGGASGAVDTVTPGLAQGDAASSHGELVVHIEAKVLSKRDFYERDAGFNPLGMLANPMILLAVAAMGITFGLPYLIDNLDPDLRAEFEEQKNNSPLSGMHKALQDVTSANGAPTPGASMSNFDLAGWMAGSKSQGAQGGGTSSSGAEVKEGNARRRG